MRAVMPWSKKLALLGVLLTSACPGPQSDNEAVGDEAMPSAADPSEFCQVATRLRCQGRADCCSDAGACDAAHELSECREDMERAISSGKASYERARAERVLAHWSAWAQRCEARFWDLAPNIWWLKGHVSEGGDCRDSSPDQNEQDMYCSDGLQCVDGRCAKQAARGESCSFQKPCVAGMSCQRGVCAPLKPTGAACEELVECEAGGCIEGRCGDYAFVTERWFCD